MFFEHAYIDMDGVLCDLQRGMLQAHDRMDLYPYDGYLTARVLGISRGALWDPIVDDGPEFWADLDIYPWAHELLDFVDKIAREVTILTRPLVVEGGTYNFRETGLCVEGKLKWLHRHLDGAHGVIFTDKKNTVSKPGTLLIDDDEAYEAAFLAAGGHQFIWPQPYNRFKQYCGNEMHSLREWYNGLDSK